MGVVVKCANSDTAEDLDLELDKLYSKAAHLCSSLTSLNRSYSSRMAAVIHVHGGVTAFPCRAPPNLAFAARLRLTRSLNEALQKK